MGRTERTKRMRQRGRDDVPPWRRAEPIAPDLSAELARLREARPTGPAPMHYPPRLLAALAAAGDARHPDGRPVDVAASDRAYAERSDVELPR